MCVLIMSEPVTMDTYKSEYCTVVSTIIEDNELFVPLLDSLFTIQF